jgi:NADPH:quinone reductase-like Zn-dependent oxidoreductase
MPKAVSFDKYGGIEVLRVVEVELPGPGPAQVLVQVKAAGINPGEAAIRQGVFAKRWPSKFPSGQGSDFAGVVNEVGREVRSYRPGDEVIGFTNERASQAEFVVVPADQLTGRPPHVPWEQAGALFVAGTTAYAAVKAVGPLTGQTLVVSGATGGVGSIAVQLAVIAGAKVIGVASETHHRWLSDQGVIPVSYGDGVARVDGELPAEVAHTIVHRIRAVSGGRVDAFIDTFGGGYVELAVGLGVPRERIDTITDFAAAQKYGVNTDGNAKAATAEVLTQLAELIETGRIEIPIAKVYRLADVQNAYRDLERRHTLGKIVLVP